ncbi:MAG: ABC transporter transmembrane domain-containing protein [Planctomycetota bacterium]|nr:ABC transporter transmembrane domain-containing protein [Planctomycetota bacterium]
MRSVRLIRPYGGWLGLVLGLLCMLALVDMAAPFFLGLLFDKVFSPPEGTEANWRLLAIILPGMGLIYVTRNTLFYSSRMLSLKISEDLCFDLRKRLFEHLQQLSLRYYRQHQPGKVSSRLMDDTFKIQSFIQDKLPMLLRYVLEFQVLLIILYAVNTPLALVSTAVLPLHLWIYRRFRGPIRRSHSEAQESLATAHGNIIERFLGMEVVKGFSAEERESVSFEEAIDASRKSKIRSQRFHFMQKVGADLAVGLGTVGLLGYGAWMVYRGHMTGGAFLMFFMYVRMLYPAVLEVISGAGHLSKATASVDRVFEMLDEPAAEGATRGEGVIELSNLDGRIEYANVNFAYDPDGPQILRDISFRIEPGERVAITGPSGSGKSTLVSLLPRFNDPTSGEVFVDGRPIDTIAIRALRGLFGLVFQEVFLFNASIYENLRYARPDATLAEMIEACRVTGAHDFIQRLSDGYYTKIGGEGAELSRGEKQRITLARALVRDPRVLIIDEATASIDQAAAREIISSILRLMDHRTVIMVTHDTELLDLVDRVISIDHGRITYDGAPEGLEPVESGLSGRRGSPLRSLPLIEPTDAGLRRSRPDREEEEHKESGASRRSSNPFTGGLAGLIALSLLLVAGCVRSTETTGSIMMEEPKISQGVFLDEPDPDRLEKMAEALDAIEVDPEGIVLDESEAVESAEPGGQDAPAAEQEPAADQGAPGEAAGAAEAEAPAAPPKMPVEQALQRQGPPPLPPEAIRLVTLPKLSATELDELLQRLALKLNAEKGYVGAGALLGDSLPAPPRGVVARDPMTRQAEGATHIVRFGTRSYLSQPPQLWVMAVTIGAEGSMQGNADLGLIEPAVSEMVASLNEMRGNLAVSDLESKLIQLSYTDATTASELLRGMGITAVNKPSEVPQKVEFAKLPYVASVPDPAAADVGLIGKGSVSGGQFGLSLTPSLASDLNPNTIASPMTQLLVMFHPAHPEQFSRVRSLIDEFIDRPARQILVEGMVLEISETGLKDLGIEWELDQAPIFFRAGSQEATGVTDTLEFETEDIDFWRVFTRDFQYIFSLKIRALIREGKAEILSRPSVLTLNNRQSTIRVGQDIPIATSQEGTAYSNKISFKFQYLATGILLNIRPRINEAGTEVSMLVDTIVSAVVPGADLELRSIEGQLLASAPTVSTRRVQTYSRIRNNTPFIIGGLVSREFTTAKDKVPLLGDLPLIGALFRAEKTDTLKREVIIVLTPYVLPEDHNIQRSLPKDEDAFDSFGHELFHDSYRIRTEDVFDLRFLLENERLTAYRNLARQAMERNFRLAEREPFKSFAGECIPGEEILVTRMVYEVVKRLEVADEISVRRAIFFEGQQAGGYDVRFIERTLAQLGGGLDYKSFFRNQRGKALAMTYHYDRTSMDPERLASEPVPELSLVDCPDRDTWGRLLWELNQPAEDGRQRYTILIQDERDLVRLRQALALKRIVTLNGGDEQLLLRNFSVGKVLLMPELKEGQVHVIDADVARYFFHTEHYYAATIKEIEDRLTELDAVLRGSAVGSPDEVTPDSSPAEEAAPAEGGK